MNDKIKEILECLEKYGQLTPDAIDDLHYIRDYITNLQTIEQQYSAILSENVELENKITNLQEENQRLKVKLENKLTPDELISMLNQELVKQNKNYKSRCEKAIIMLKELNKKLKDILKIGIDIKEISDIENILNGSDE